MQHSEFARRRYADVLLPEPLRYAVPGPFSAPTNYL
jgi:hypothetical protein